MTKEEGYEVEERIKKLLLKMEELKLDAMLIGSRSNRMYMSGFTGSNAMLYISKTKQILMTDFRYIEQSTRECKNYEIVNQGDVELMKVVMQIAQDDQAKTIGFESAHINYYSFLKFGTYKEFKFVPTYNLIEDFRKVKDSDEIQKLTQAESIGDLAFSHIIPFITAEYKNGLTENDIALELERIMRKNGASGTSFATIVAAGSKSSLPHAQPGDEVLKQGDFVVMDFGCTYEGYCSDMTRTIVIGEPTPKHRAIYAVYEINFLN